MATMVVSSAFVDTNILSYAQLAKSPFHLQAKARLLEFEAQGVELWISRQILREYLAVMTRPGTLTGQIPVADLIRDTQDFEAQFRIAEDSQIVTENLRTILRQVAVGGKQVHDANIVATMQAYGIPQLLTHNVGDFTRFGRLITVLPLEIAP